MELSQQPGITTPSKARKIEGNPTMSNYERLRSEVATLQAILKGDEPLDANAKASLLEIANDLQSVLTESDASTEEATPEEVQGLSDRLRAFLLDFELEHPRLTSTVTQVNELLSSIGI